MYCALYIFIKQIKNNNKYYYFITLTVNYEVYVIVLVIPHNSHNNVASSDVFICV